jgi:hypothetical protein
MALKRCAELDANGVYLGMVEVDEADLTAQHLPQIGECDLEARSYRWAPDAESAYGGRFEPLLPHQRPKVGGTPSLEGAFYATLKGLSAQGIPLAVEATAWLQWYEQTLDRQSRG